MLSLWCASNSFNAELNIFNQRFVPKMKLIGLKSILKVRGGSRIFRQSRDEYYYGLASTVRAVRHHILPIQNTCS